jgi:hypothetical protein
MVNRALSALFGVLVGLGVIAYHQSAAAGATVDRDCAASAASGVYAVCTR